MQDLRFQNATSDVNHIHVKGNRVVKRVDRFQMIQAEKLLVKATELEAVNFSTPLWSISAGILLLRPEMKLVYWIAL